MDIMQSYKEFVYKHNPSVNNVMYTDNTILYMAYELDKLLKENNKDNDKNNCK